MMPVGARAGALACPCGRSYTHAEPASAVAIVRCPSCGTGTTVPPPTRDVHGDGLFEDVDAGYGGDRLASREQWFHEAQLRLRWMALPPGARILEIGAATGEFVAAAERAGHPVTGLETSPRAVADATSVTTQVRRFALTDWIAEGRYADAVAMFHVLEHVPDSHAFLTEIRGALAPTGALYLEVPNGGSYLARRDGVDWWAARPQDHVVHFTRRGLVDVLSRAGFHAEVRAVHPDIYVDARTRRRGLLVDIARPLLRRGRRSYDLLRAVARPLPVALARP